MSSALATRKRWGYGVRIGRSLVILLALAATLTATAAATTVQGSFSYAGLPVGATFGNLGSCVVHCYSYACQASNTYTLDPTTGTYTLPVDLAPGQYMLLFLLSPRAGRTDVHPASGELFGAVQATVPASSPFVVNPGLTYAVHVLAPFDSLQPWSGSKDQCPRGPEAPIDFTLAWQTVPRAVNYSVHLERWDCTHQLAEETIATSVTSTEIVQQRVPGEAYVVVRIDALDEASRTISLSPMVLYSDGEKGALYLRAPTGSGRPVHQAGAKFVVGAGHKQGAKGTFWKTDLTLTNPTSGPITADLYYTERDVSGTATFTPAQVDLPAHASRGFADAVDSLFHVTGFGSIEVMPGVVEVLSRTYTAGPNPPGGAYGQGYPPVAADATASLDGETAVLGSGFVLKGASRTNLALVEVWGEPAHVAVRLADRNGNPLGSGSLEYDVPPLGNIQLNDVPAIFGVSSLTEGQVTVEVLSGEGRVAGCLSVVDNSSQDPATLPLVRRFK